MQIELNDFLNNLQMMKVKINLLKLMKKMKI